MDKLTEAYQWVTATKWRWVPALCVIVAVIAWAWGKTH